MNDRGYAYLPLRVETISLLFFIVLSLGSADQAIGVEFFPETFEKWSYQTDKSLQPIAGYTNEEHFIFLTVSSEQGLSLTLHRYALGFFDPEFNFVLQVDGGEPVILSIENAKRIDPVYIDFQPNEVNIFFRNRDKRCHFFIGELMRGNKLTIEFNVRFYSQERFTIPLSGSSVAINKIVEDFCQLNE